MKLDFAAKGGALVEKQLKARVERTRRKHKDATKAAAEVFQGAVKRNLPKRKGALRRHVRIYPKGEEGWKVKVTGREAHLVLGDTKAHEIDPKGSDAANSGHRRAIGPVQGKRALAFKGADHPFARAMIPAHTGDHTVMQRAQAEASSEARAAAMEVLGR